MLQGGCWLAVVVLVGWVVVVDDVVRKSAGVVELLCPLPPEFGSRRTSSLGGGGGSPFTCLLGWIWLGTWPQGGLAVGGWGSVGR